MHSAADYETADTAATREARQRVLAYIKVGAKEQQRLIDYCAKNIPRDRYVPPSKMRFDTPAGISQIEVDRGPLIIDYELGPNRREAKRIHKHALGQLCDYAGMARIYATKLDEDSPKAWRRDLLAHNLNTLFKHQEFVNRLKKPASFLHRLVGDELRAVLTQSYNRHLVSNAVLQPFLAVAAEVGLQAAKATITDMRVHLQTYLPYAFEPIPGELIALGTSWSNSDFGQGKLRISHTVLRLNGGGLGNLVTDDAFSRMHLTSVVEETDLALDDQVAVKELETVAAATKSAVREAMKPEQVTKLLNAIRKAHEEKIPWDELKTKLGRFLGKDAVGTVEAMLKEQIVDLPSAGIGSDGRALPSRWWAAAALAHLSEKQVDATKAMDLKQAAGSFLATGT